MRLWLIPLIYTIVAFACGFTLPRIEYAFLEGSNMIAVSSAQAYLSAVASGMMAITGIVFAVAFVVVQFSSVAYSPRLVLWLARDPLLFHSLGTFIATFVYSLWSLAWVDRGGSGRVPLVSAFIVGGLLVISMVLFARLVQSLNNLQISNVLHTIGDRGREVIAAMFERVDESSRRAAAMPPAAVGDGLAPATQTVIYAGSPRVIAEFDLDRLVRTAQQAGAVIVMIHAVGDTIFEGNPLISVHGAQARLDERELLHGVKLSLERTFEQDPKYALRLLVDIAIRALSPAVNDPTTAVQALDQIEDLLRRLGRGDLEPGNARDAGGALRVVYPKPSWEDYLDLAFDEIRLFGNTSVQVMRRLRSTLVDLAASLTNAERAEAVRRCLLHLDLGIERSPLDDEDRETARHADRQGLGQTRRDAAEKPSAT